MCCSDRRLYILGSWKCIMWNCVVKLSEGSKADDQDDFFFTPGMGFVGPWHTAQSLGVGL